MLHTSDWHLGHTLHDVARDHEHARFLSWLLDTLEREAVDALLIAGDVFDSANPPARAQAAWFRFLADARRRAPGLDVVVIGGNHDSAARLDAPQPLLDAMRIRVVGGVRRDGRAPERGIGRGLGAHAGLDHMLAPITDARGEVAAIVAAVPFLRPADLPRVGRGSDAPLDTCGDAMGDTNGEPRDDAADGERDPLIEGVRATYSAVLAAARARMRPGQALIAMGHCYMSHTRVSALSERRILGGNQHALPADIFPDDVAYAALGHLHRAQRVAGRDWIRYSGSPIPLAMDEARYRHQVVIADFDGARLSEIRTIAIPRTVELLRVPRRGAAPIDEVVAALAALPPSRDAPRDASRDPTGEPGGDDPASHWTDSPDAPDTRPFLEVCVALPRPDVTLRQTVDRALAGRRARLVKLTVEYTGDGYALGDVAIEHELRDLHPDDVFRRRYHRDYEADPPPELVAAFHELLDALHARDAV